MDQNNVAASGWGAPIPETTYTRSESQQTSEEGSDYSDEFYDSEEDDEEEEEYAPLQMGSWGTQPSGDQADVNAIQMPDWNQRPKDETPSLTFTSADWGKLCDPKVVVKSGIGSGNLHRKGANYKPVDEQHILNQRLKLGSPMPGSGKKKKRGGAKTGKKPKPPGIPPSRRPPPSAPRPPSSTASRRPPLAQSAWGNSQLASTPFWESGGAKSSKYASTPTSPAPAAPTPPAAPAPQQRLPGGRPAPTGWAASKWANQALQTNPVAPSPQPTATPPKPSGAAASKYAPKPVAQPAPVAPTPVAAAAPPPPPPTTAVHGTISLNEPIRPPRETIFQLNIELIPGVSAILPVYETDDYIALVKEFGAKHHLTISEQAEASFAEKIKMMVATLRKQQAEQ